MRPIATAQPGAAAPTRGAALPQETPMSSLPNVSPIALMPFHLGLAFVLASTLAIVCLAAAPTQPPEERPSDEASATESAPPPMPGERLGDEQVTAFARLALEGMFQEFPNKPGIVLAGPESVKSPREHHPAFYGCFDWHSAVHGHWMLVRLLRHYPNATVAPTIRESLARSLTRDNLEKEAAFFREKHNKSFERTYGWAWLLRLAAELRTFDDPDARRFSKHLEPLEKEIVRLAKEFLPKLSWPIRTGQHPDSGFALAQFLDYARTVGDDELEALVVAKSRKFYAGDRDYPVAYEPSGFDFFSSGLNEADLMRRVLAPKEFSTWLDGFFPGLAKGRLGNLLEPAHVTDVTDGKLVHLAGLDLVRAWTFHGIATALAEEDPRVPILRDAVRSHADVGLSYVFSGDYAGEHWLASFAVYLLTEVGIERR
jgi:hypothetical protein